MPDASVRPFLMFEGSAEEAMNFYVSLFPGAKVLDNLRYRANEAGAEGGSMPFRSRRHFVFRRVLLESGDWPALLSSRFRRRYPHALGWNGFSRRFAWVSGRFGVSWQLNLPCIEALPLEFDAHPAICLREGPPRGWSQFSTD